MDFDQIKRDPGRAIDRIDELEAANKAKDEQIYLLQRFNANTTAKVHKLQAQLHLHRVKRQELEAQVDELMEPKTISEDNSWSMRENGHYGLDLFYGEIGIARMSKKAYAQLVEYMSSTVTNKAQVKAKEVE